MYDLLSYLEKNLTLVFRYHRIFVMDKHSFYCRDDALAVGLCKHRDWLLRVSRTVFGIETDSFKWHLVLNALLRVVAWDLWHVGRWADQPHHFPSHPPVPQDCGVVQVPVDLPSSFQIASDCSQTICPQASLCGSAHPSMWVTCTSQKKKSWSSLDYPQIWLVFGCDQTGKSDLLESAVLVQVMSGWHGFVSWALSSLGWLNKGGWADVIDSWIGSSHVGKHREAMEIQQTLQILEVVGKGWVLVHEWDSTIDAHAQYDGN